MSLHFLSAEGGGTRQVGRGRVAALSALGLLAVLAAFSLSGFGGGHAHAATSGVAHVLASQVEMAAGTANAHQAGAHAVPCDDGGTDQGGQDGCCLSTGPCGICAPVPSAGLVLVAPDAPAAFALPSVSLPRDPPTLPRPPKLSVAA